MLFFWPFARPPPTHKRGTREIYLNISDIRGLLSACCRLGRLQLQWSQSRIQYSRDTGARRTPSKIEIRDRTTSWGAKSGVVRWSSPPSSQRLYSYSLERVGCVVERHLHMNSRSRAWLNSSCRRKVWATSKSSSSRLLEPPWSRMPSMVAISHGSPAPPLEPRRPPRGSQHPRCCAINRHAARLASRGVCHVAPRRR